MAKRCLSKPSVSIATVSPSPTFGIFVPPESGQHPSSEAVVMAEFIRNVFKDIQLSHLRQKLCVRLMASSLIIFAAPKSDHLLCRRFFEQTYLLLSEESARALTLS
jgi:hypothetical protein